jgi:hypothetical protein
MTPTPDMAPLVDDLEAAVNALVRFDDVTVRAARQDLRRRLAAARRLRDGVDIRDLLAVR